MKNSNFALENLITDYNSRMIAIFAGFFYFILLKMRKILEIACILSCFALILLGKANINNFGQGLKEKLLPEPKLKVFENSL